MIGAITVGALCSSVQLVPNAPTIGTATGGDASASVAFTASGSGPAATSFTATSSPGGFTATGSSSPLTVTGLTNGTAYTFTVYATNAFGNSASSAASNSVTPAVVVNTQIFISGGNAGNGSNKLSYMYNISSDTYTSKTDRTQDAGEYPAAGYYDGSVYVYGGGYSASYTYNYAYSVSGNSWTSKTAMPAGRLDNGYLTYNNKIWQFGGKASGANTTYATNYYYDPVANTFTQIADLPATRGVLKTGVIGTKFYVNGGYTNSGSSSYPKSTYEYTVSSNTWATKADSQYTHSKGGVGGSSDGTYLYCLYAAEPGNNTAEKYNPSSNSWSNVTNSTNTLSEAQSAALYNADGKIYVPSNTVQTATQVYSVSGNSWTGKTGTTSVTMQYYGAALVP